MKGALIISVMLGATATAQAAEGVYHEFHGVRATAMGEAHRGLGTSNETLYLNPAGMSIARRYAIEAQYGYSPFDGLSHINASIVDSQSGPVAGGIAYTYALGDRKGVDASLHRFLLASSYDIVDGALALGISTKYLRGSFKRDGKRVDANSFTGDVGIMGHFPFGLGLGVTFNNALKTKHRRLAPPTLGSGLSYQYGGFVMAADLNVDFTKLKHRLLSYHVGAEYFAGGMFPIRAGYRRSPFRKADGTVGTENVVGGGLAWVSQHGGIDLGFDIAVDRPEHWQLAAALKLFL